MCPSVSADTPPWLRFAEIPLLAELPHTRLAEGWAASRPEHYGSGEALRREGEPADRLVLLLSGRVAATSVTANGTIIRHGAWTSPCALDKIAVIDGQGHTATFTAETEVHARALLRDSFLALIDDAATVRGHVLRKLAGEARRQQARVVDAVLPAQARLAAWLLREADPAGIVRLPASQQQLAEVLGLTRVTVNRALGTLRRDGLIERDRRTGLLRLPAPELLQLRAL
jgi:CRP/FNR family transcriptional regulator, cyclic AMP receptor protein